MNSKVNHKSQAEALYLKPYFLDPHGSPSLPRPLARAGQGFRRASAIRAAKGEIGGGGHKDVRPYLIQPSIKPDATAGLIGLLRGAQ